MVLVAYAPHTLVQFGGFISDAGTDNEIWTCGVRVLGPDASEAAAYMAAISAPLGVWFGGVAQCVGSATLNYVKVNHIDPDGLYTDKTTTNVYDYSPEINGTAGQNIPAVLSKVTTWLTDNSRGHASKGRIFLPNYSKTSGGSMFLNAADQTAVVNAGRALITLLSVAYGGAATAYPVVASKIDGSVNRITKVACGNVIDVQQRRKNALKETYMVAAV